jgi:hypothetical protein
MQPLRSWEEVAFNNEHLSGKVTETLLNIRALGAAFDDTHDAAQWSTSPLKSAVDYVFAQGNEHDYTLAFLLLEGKRTPRLYMLDALCSWAERRTDEGQSSLFDWHKALSKEADYWRQRKGGERKAQDTNMHNHMQQTMTREEAEIVFREWQAYGEINDKLFQLFGPSIPKSFLPYPPDVLTEAIKTIANVNSETEDRSGLTMLQEHMSAILCYKDDDEAVNTIVNGIRLKHTELRKIFIHKLQKSRDSWALMKGYRPRT